MEAKICNNLKERLLEHYKDHVFSDKELEDLQTFSNRVSGQVVDIVLIPGAAVESIDFTWIIPGKFWKEVIMSRYNVFSDRFQKKYITTGTFGGLPLWVCMVLRRQYEAKATGKWYGY